MGQAWGATGGSGLGNFALGIFIGTYSAGKEKHWEAIALVTFGFGKLKGKLQAKLKGALRES